MYKKQAVYLVCFVVLTGVAICTTPQVGGSIEDTKGSNPRDILGITLVPYAKTQLKIPQIARWRIAGITDKKIAELLHMTHPGLARLLATPEYQEFEAAYLSGHLSEMDRRMAGRIDEIRQEMRCAVPAALRCLVETATQKRDLKAAMQASIEILDRDPDKTLTKESQVGEGDFRVPEAVIDAAGEEGNKISAQKDTTPPPKVN